MRIASDVTRCPPAADVVSGLPASFYIFCASAIQSTHSCVPRAHGHREGERRDKFFRHNRPFLDPLLEPVAESPASRLPSVLFVTPECAPLVKTGGLGDVSATLPPALRALGVDVRMLMPGYPALLAAFPMAPELARLQVLGESVRVRQAELASGVPLYMLDCPPLYDRRGGPYQADDGEEWHDNARRFGVLSRVAAMLGSGTLLGPATSGEVSDPSQVSDPIAWRPDVVHVHDWQAALAPLYLRFAAGRRAASLVTIHNLAFQGVFDMPSIAGLQIPPEALGVQGMEYYGKASFLKAGLVYADAINTVSPRYAEEIQTDALGFGMQGVLRQRRAVLSGVLNGIDTDLWNPQSDPHLAARYGPLTLEKKRDNKLAFKQRMGLAGRSDVPLFAMVSRLAHQKGVDLVLEAAERIAAMPAQLAIVGTGDRGLVEKLRALQARMPQATAIFVGFDESLAHLLEAGADAFLMPSRFEPCGMNQMYSQRYGTPPLGNATGGLVDTIVDGTMDPGARATGFLMRDATADELVRNVHRAVTAYRDTRAWRTLQLNGMARDFGWSQAARQYLALYEKLRKPGLSP